MLTLFEEIFLLALDEEKGAVAASSQQRLSFAFAGGVLAELALQGKLQASANRRLEILDHAETGDSVLDKALKAIHSSDHPRKASYWVKALLERPRKLQTRVGERLVSGGFLTHEDGDYLWVVPSPLNPDRKTSAKFEVKQRLRLIVLACEPADVRSLSLLNLARASRLLKLVFTQDERRAAERLIHQLLVQEALQNPVAQTIEEIGGGVASNL